MSTLPRQRLALALAFLVALLGNPPLLHAVGAARPRSSN